MFARRLRQGWPRRRAPRASAEASSGPKPAQMAPVGSYRPAQYLLRLLERVLKVLGGLTIPDWQVEQHRLQVRGSDGAQPGQVRVEGLRR